MHLHFEKNNNAKCDCNILSLSWMGKVPDESPEDEGWQLDRINYYQEGWLATGNARGLVGVTFTTSHCRTRAAELPLRANYNLRGHRSEQFTDWMMTNTLNNVKYYHNFTVLEIGSFNASDILFYFATSRKEAHEGYQLAAASLYALSARYTSHGNRLQNVWVKSTKKLDCAMQIGAIY